MSYPLRHTDCSHLLNAGTVGRIASGGKDGRPDFCLGEEVAPYIARLSASSRILRSAREISRQTKLGSGLDDESLSVEAPSGGGRLVLWRSGSLDMVRRRNEVEEISAGEEQGVRGRSRGHRRGISLRLQFAVGGCRLDPTVRRMRRHLGRWPPASGASLT